LAFLKGITAFFRPFGEREKPKSMKGNEVYIGGAARLGNRFSLISS
jgi:hypothetical protein